MATTREVMGTVIALERETMTLYARFSRLFRSDPDLHDFWFKMARDEAGHLGALDLVSTVLESEGVLDRPSPVPIDDKSIVRLRGLLDGCKREAEKGPAIERALEIALQLEETEVEDLVAHLLKQAQSEREHERYMRLLVHDLGDLSYMIEKHSKDPELLHRC